MAESRSKVILGKQKPLRGRPGASAPKIDLDKNAKTLKRKLGSKYSEDDLFSSLMYPKVYEDFLDFQKVRGCFSSSHYCLFPWFGCWRRNFNRY